MLMTHEPPETDAWLRELREGQPEALAALLQFYQPRLRQMLRLRIDPRLAARVDVSDVLQEVYLDAARQVAAYLREPRVAFYVWLRGLTWERLSNVQRQHLGTQRRAVSREVPLPAESSALLARQLLAGGSGPSEAVVKEEQRRRVQEALVRLKPEDREVILLRHFENLTNTEVAQALGLSAAAATMRYGRALLRLKELLTEGTAGGATP